MSSTKRARIGLSKHLRVATELNSLRTAWFRIRSNGRLSSAEETRAAISDFGQNAERNLKAIQGLVRDRKFEFDPQKGVLKTKSSGSKRGIVMASVRNRVIERALLDYLQSNCNLVKDVNNQPSSVGGVPDRSVPHGLKLIHDAFSEGKEYFVRSDISGFFDNIPRTKVLDRVAADINDANFMALLTCATSVVLENEKALGEDRRVFPTDTEGVAQGSPLSPLFGNILLYDFDIAFNSRGICCVRFIDDFVLLGKSEGEVTSAFHSAKIMLEKLDLTCHDPFNPKTRKDKAAFGKIADGFVFLRYDIRPGLLQPSASARRKLEDTVSQHLRTGRNAIMDVKRNRNSFEARQRYAQTHALLDKVIRGWGEAFAYSNSPATIADLDRSIDEKIDSFKRWFVREIRDADWKTRRRLGGVGLLEDIKRKSFDELPMKLGRSARFIKRNGTITISTDGAICGQGRKPGKDQGPGGWAFVVHGTTVEKGGNALSATNNQMELRAVLEALKHVDTGASVIIETDSQYVSNTINRGDVVKSNLDLLKEYRNLASTRNVKVFWVKGHNGNPENEKADVIAGVQAKLAQRASKNTTHQHG